MIVEALGKFATAVIENKSVLLSTANGIGNIATFIFTIRANDKATARRTAAQEAKGEELTKFERVVAEAPAYILPGAICAGSTILCALNEHGHAVTEKALIGSIAAISKRYCNFRSATNEVVSEEDKLEIAEKQAVLNPETLNIATEAEQYHEGKELFYDEFSDQLFWAKREWMLKAEKTLNRIYDDIRHISIGSFYELLQNEGVEEIDSAPIYKHFGWSKWHTPRRSACPPGEIKIVYIPTKLPYGDEYYVIQFMDEPEEGYYGW